MESNPKAAWSVIHALQDAMSEGSHGLSAIPGLIVRVVNKELWREFYCEPLHQIVRFASFSEYVTDDVPSGLGTDIKTLKNLCRDDPQALDAVDRATKGQQGKRTDLLDNIQEVNTPAPTGTSRDATIRRLREHHPELHAKVMAKDLSANAAAIEAGIRKRQIQVPVGDPRAAAKRLLKHYSKPELIEAIQLADAQ